MIDLKKYKFHQLYDMSSGITSKPDQAGHGTHFVSFSTVFNNYFLPDTLDNLMNTSEREQEIYSVKKGDIFLTRTSETIDELGMSSVAIKDYPKATYSGFVKRLRPTQNNITYDKFMGFYLRSSFFRKTMTNNAVMTLRASLNEEIFSYLDLHLPDFGTQKKIGDLLFTINSKIDVNGKIIQQLEQLAKTIYNHWFVQFDFPNEKNKPYRSSGGKMIYNKVLKKEIPQDWRDGKLHELIALHDSKRVPLSNKQRENRKGIYPYYGATEIMDHIDEFIFDGIYVLLAEDGSVMDKNGNPVLQYIWGKSWVNNHAHVLEGRGVSNEYLHLMLKTISVIQIMSGTIQKKINQENLKMTPIMIIGESLAKRFDEVIQPLYSKIRLVSDEKNKLTKLRDFLLPMLINGQIKVKDLEEKIALAAEPSIKYTTKLV